MLPFRQLFPSGAGLPENTVVSEAPVHELLESSDLLIYCDTTVALEALMKRIPLLHFQGQCHLDADPLERAPEFKTDVGSAEEIVEAVTDFLVRGKQTAGSCEDRRNFLLSCLCPVNDNTMAAFLK